MKNDQTPANCRDAFSLREFLVEPSVNRITSHAGTTQVEPRVMCLLVALAERPGQVWSRQELLDTVWADTIVNDEALTRAVSHLRRHLEDGPESPRFIETVRKGGYRLLCPVTLSPLDKAVRTTMRVSNRLVSTRKAVVGIGLLGVATAGAIWTATSEDAVDAAASFPPGVVTLTSYQGREGYPSVSPGGSMVAFAHREASSDSIDLFVKHFQEETPLRLTADGARETFSAWSPDGAELVFARSDSQGHGVYLIPAIGGHSRLLFSARSRISGLSWSPFGDEIAFTDRAGRGTPDEIRVFNLLSGQTRVLTSPPTTSLGDIRPAYSPDGSEIAFVRGDAIGNQDIWTIRASGGAAVQLTKDGLGVAGVTWTPDGDRIVYGGIASGSSGIWSLDVTTTDKSWLGVPGEWVHDPVIASRTGVLVYVESQLEHNIWSLDVGSDAYGNQGGEVLIGSTRSDIEPQFSPDGSQISFMSTRTGSRELWVADATGQNPVVLSRTEGGATGNPRWSPDGNSVAFYAFTGEVASIQIVDVSSGNSRTLSTADANCIPLAWSHDGTAVYFRSDREDGWQIWRTPEDRFEPERITTGGGRNVWEDVRGNWLYLTRMDGRGLWRLRAGGTEHAHEVELVLETFLHHPLSFWQGWNEQLMTATPSDGRYEVQLVDPSTGVTRSLALIPGSSPLSFSLSPDGSRLLYSHTERSESDLKRLDLTNLENVGR